MKWTYSLYVAALPLMAAPSFAQDRVRATEPAPAEAASGYLKIGDIKGESQDQANAAEWKMTTHAPDPQAGDEHEIEYDIIKGAFTGNGPTFLRGNPDGDNTIPRPRRMATRTAPAAADTSHDKWIIIESFDWGAVQATGSGLPTGRRQHRPVVTAPPMHNEAGTLTISGDFGGCAVGTKFSNITLKRGLVSYMMEGVEVASCSASMEREQISLNYEKITVKY